MSSIVRQSKFRHVFCKPIKHEHCVSDIRITEITWDSLFAAVNPKFIAVIVKGSGGPFLVIPINKSGRIDKDHPFVDAHRAPCLEVAWSPFNDCVIASCSEDTTAKVWLIPERGLNRNLVDPVVELSGHQKRVNTLAWHPTVNNLLLTVGGENKLLLWNVGTGEALLEIAGHPDQIWSAAFNYDGSRIVTTCKDRQLRIIDAHTGDVVQQGQGHEGVKPQRAIFTADGRLITTGFTKRSERLYALRDPDKLSEPLIEEELDTSNGVLFPLYDEDSGLVYLAGKGDCAIRYYEVNQDYPFMHYINTYTTSEPQRGIAFMSKRGINSNENEINRIYKVTTKGIIDVLQFFVPRKSDLFQTDLYPDTRSTVPSLTVEQWLEGANAPPRLVPLNPGAAEAKPKVTVAKKANILAQLPPSEELTQQAPRSFQPPPQSPRQEPSSPQQRQNNQRFSAPIVDDDMGIVRFDRAGPERPSMDRNAERPPPAPQQLPKQQVQLRSRGEREGGNEATAGQRRAAAELERIKRDQRSEPDSSMMLQASPAMSPRGSVSSMPDAVSMEDMAGDIQKMKTIIRQHERRIRLLEDQLADRNMADTYGYQDQLADTYGL